MKTFMLIALLATCVFTEEAAANGMCKEGKDEYCAVCTSDKCSTCYASSLKTETGQCMAVSPEVEGCSSYTADSTTCVACSDGTKWVGSGKCNAIDMTDCLRQKDATTCSFCDGKLLDGKACSDVACSTIDANCTSCMKVGETNTCAGCKEGYKVEGGKCVEGKVTTPEMKTTSDGCADSTDGKCALCKYGYYVNSASSADTMTCAKSTRYTSVAILKSIALALFAIALF